MSEIEQYRAIQTESVKLAANQAIIDKYSIEKQLNILRLANGYTQADLDQMSGFIDSIRAQSDQFETQIQVASLEQLKSFDFRSEVFNG